MAATPNQTISTKTLAFSWPIQVPKQYLSLIDARKPEALVILAHYAIMLQMINSLWFMKGWATRILEECQQNLESEWHFHLAWPISVVGPDTKVQ
jgi:hypothetical protein